MTKMISLLAIAALAATASADQWKTVKDDPLSTKQYIYEISYPEFNATSIPAHRVINAAVKKDLIENSCDTSDMDPGQSMDYSGSAKVAAINRRYTTVMISYDSYCGGAHPSSGTYALTFDSQTGIALNIANEFGFNDSNDWQTEEKLRGQIGEILADNLPADVESNCFDGMTRKEKLEELNLLYPVVEGLAKHRTVILGTSPAHIAAACEFQIRVPLAKIQHLLIPGSYLNTWLK